MRAMPQKQILRRALAMMMALSGTLSAAGQETRDSVLIMNDGVPIETTLMLPAPPGPQKGFPAVVFIHGLGGNKDDIGLVGSVLTSRGYASLTYSVRGQGKSGGLSTIMGPREVEDLRAVVAYLRSRPGVDADAIGIAGGSQGGVHAWIAAIERIPGVRCIATLLAPPSYAADLAPNNCIKQQLQAELTLGTVRFDPLRDRIRSFVLAENTDSIHAFMMERDLAARVDSVSIPVIQGLGWKDVIFPVNGAIRARESLVRRGIPVWSYFGTNGHAEPVNLPEYIFTIEMVFTWFDHWLKGTSLPDAAVPRVVYADDRPAWPHHETPVWPPAGSTTLRLYPGRGPHGGTGSLNPAPPGQTDTHPFSQTYDPSYLPEQAWDQGYKGAAFRSAFTSATTARFLSPPVADTMEITGSPAVQLTLTGDGGPFQAHARIFHVTGVDTGIVWQLLTRCTMGITTSTPGGEITAGAEGEALSHRIPPGHHIGLEITSVDMFDADRAHIIPYFRSSSAGLLTSPAGISFVDLPLALTGGFAVTVPPSQPRLPEAVVLHQNYPNPFNPSTTIRFATASSGPVRLDVWSITGQHVATLVDGPVAVGVHSIPFHSRGLASGLYVYRLTSREGTRARTMVLVR